MCINFSLWRNFMHSNNQNKLFFIISKHQTIEMWFSYNIFYLISPNIFTIDPDFILGLSLVHWIALIHPESSEILKIEILLWSEISDFFIHYPVNNFPHLNVCWDDWCHDYNQLCSNIFWCSFDVYNLFIYIKKARYDDTHTLTGIILFMF